jgi:putative NADH-flavin reductase
MKILVLGATGPSGLQFVQQALEQKHEVTAFVRNPAKLPSAPNLRVIKGELSDATQLQEALKGQDLVVSALGIGQNFKPNGFMTKTANTLIPLMEKVGPKRLIWLSAFGVGEYKKEAPLMAKIFFSTLLKNVFADKLSSENVLRASRLDWTLVYPVMLTDGPKTQKYRVGEHLKLSGMPKVSRADVADFMLKQLSDSVYVRKVAVVSN